MKNIKIYLLIYFSFLSLSANAYFYDGNALQSSILKHNSAVLGYIEGVADSNRERGYCIPPGTTARDLQNIVDNYLKENNEVLNSPANKIIVAAFIKEWPCSKELSK